MISANAIIRNTYLDRINVCQINTLIFKTILDRRFSTRLSLKSDGSIEMFCLSLNCVLGIIVPEDPNFSVSDVRAFVGSRRKVDVMECKTQRALEMSMREFERYFQGNDRKHIYNVISLEFSQSKLETMIKRPTVVDSLDWIDLVWPQHLKNIQTDQTNKLHSMKYPKVQKYCLMSVAGCYTDFHIDFGGTSVWYHILKGGKIFWLIPPTESNLALFERWTLSGSQGDTFLGDIVPKCQRIELEAGNSLMIPSGWIHAVYTPKDSLVFGGNFLNSFNIPMQLRISHLEERLKVPNRFRFPFFTEVMWYALERYIHTLTGESFLDEEFQKKNMIFENLCDNKENDDSRSHVHLTPFEYKGLQKLVEELSCLFDNNCDVPEGIVTPGKLLEAGRNLLDLHSDDDDNLAVSGKPKAYWPKTKQSHLNTNKTPKKPKACRPVTNGSNVKPSSGRVRRIRCKQCEACLSEDCKECVYCQDMKKYGGPGTLKKSCVKRKCENPLLPDSAKVSQQSSSNGLEVVNVSPEKRKSIPDNHDEFASKKSKATPSPDSNLTSTVSLPSVRISRVRSVDLIKYSSNCNDCVPSNVSDDFLTPSMLQYYKPVWLNVFKYLKPADLENCKSVCRDFSECCRLSLAVDSIESNV